MLPYGETDCMGTVRQHAFASFMLLLAVFMNTFLHSCCQFFFSMLIYDIYVWMNLLMYLNAVMRCNDDNYGTFNDYEIL